MSRSILLRTAIPGPRSAAVLERRRSSVPRGIAHATPICVEQAQGAVVIDVDGNRLIDFAGGIGTLNVGHADPDVVRAAQAQLARLTHACFAVALYEGYVSLAESLNRITPGSFAKKTMLVNSGAEAVENAVKIARRATGREAVVVFDLVGDTQEEASGMARAAYHVALHFPVDEYRAGSITTIAHPYSSPVTDRGPIFRFTLNHQLVIDDVAERRRIFRTTMHEVGKR